MNLIVAHFLREDIDRNGAVVRAPVGTVFFLGWSLPEEAGTILYAVTARHIIEEARAGTGTAFVRVNRHGGAGYEDLQTDPRAWTCHPESDVAAIRWPFRNGYEQDGFIVERLMGADDAVPYPHVGDPVTFLGLFTHSPGSFRNEPIARFGKVSRLADEKVRIEVGPEHWKEVDAYLVETLSWGGNSGAPALHYLPDNVPGKGPNKADRGPWILGLMHGHSNEWEYVIDREKPKEELPCTRYVVKMNSGIGIVIPSERILETFDQEPLVEERRRLVEEARARRSFTKD